MAPIQAQRKPSSRGRRQGARALGVLHLLVIAQISLGVFREFWCKPQRGQFLVFTEVRALFGFTPPRAQSSQRVHSLNRSRPSVSHWRSKLCGSRSQGTLPGTRPVLDRPAETECHSGAVREQFIVDTPNQHPRFDKTVCLNRKIHNSTHARILSRCCLCALDVLW